MCPLSNFPLLQMLLDSTVEGFTIKVQSWLGYIMVATEWGWVLHRIGHGTFLKPQRMKQAAAPASVLNIWRILPNLRACPLCRFATLPAETTIPKWRVTATIGQLLQLPTGGTLAFGGLRVLVRLFSIQACDTPLQGPSLGRPILGASNHDYLLCLLIYVDFWLLV